MMIRFHFEDRGQDCLWWDVEESDTGIAKIVGSNLQEWQWANGKHFVNLNEPHREGFKLAFTDDLDRSLATSYSRVTNYRVVKVEYLNEGAVQ